MKGNNHIIYFDINDIDYSSYFLTGFYQNKETFQYKFTVSKKTPPLLLDQIENHKWKDILSFICLLKVELSADSFYFCIDLRDSCEADPNNKKGYHMPLLKKVKYYFKVNYNKEVINNDPDLKEFANKIIPSLPFFSIKYPQLLTSLPRIFPNSAIGWTMGDSIQRIKMLKSRLSLEQIRQMRNSKKEQDLFFVVRYYRHKKHSADNAFRYQIMEEILNHPEINAIVGFTSHEKIKNSKYAALQLKPYPLKDYLNCLSKSRIAIYVRGLHNCLSFKFGELLLLGLPIVGQTIHNNKENIMHHKYFNEQFAHDDPKTIVEQVIQFLGNPEKQLAVGISNANVFDTKFTPKAVVSDILRHIQIIGQNISNR